MEGQALNTLALRLKFSFHHLAQMLEFSENNIIIQEVMLDEKSTY